jgi:hypothetical protein
METKRLARDELDLMHELALAAQEAAELARQLDQPDLPPAVARDLLQELHLALGMVNRAYRMAKARLG